VYGMIEIDGKQYIERYQCFPLDLTVTSNLQIFTQQRIVLPGVAPFLLKALTRDTIVAGASTVRRFKFKLGNTDGNVWYSGAGVGGTNDRVVDSLIFGDGRFPFPLIPHIFYGSTASIIFEVEDISSGAPYTISFGFHGSYLIPA
jgi:hypothetical protein